MKKSKHKGTMRSEPLMTPDQFLKALSESVERLEGLCLMNQSLPVVVITTDMRGKPAIISSKNDQMAVIEVLAQGIRTLARRFTDHNQDQNRPPTIVPDPPTEDDHT